MMTSSEGRRSIGSLRCLDCNRGMDSARQREVWIQPIAEDVSTVAVCYVAAIRYIAEHDIQVDERDIAQPWDVLGTLRIAPTCEVASIVRASDASCTSGRQVFVFRADPAVRSSGYYFRMTRFARRERSGGVPGVNGSESYMRILRVRFDFLLSPPSAKSPRSSPPTTT